MGGKKGLDSCGACSLECEMLYYIVSVPTRPSLQQIIVDKMAELRQNAAQQHSEATGLILPLPPSSQHRNIKPLVLPQVPELVCFRFSGATVSLQALLTFKDQPDVVVISFLTPAAKLCEPPPAEGLRAACWEKLAGKSCQPVVIFSLPLPSGSMYMHPSLQRKSKLLTLINSSPKFCSKLQSA